MSSKQSDRIIKKTGEAGSRVKGQDAEPDQDTGKGDDVGYDELRIENEVLRARLEFLEKRDRLNTSLLHNISREIRTPLNTLTGFCSFLSDPALTAEKRSAFARIINESGEQLLSVVTDILNVAHTGDSKRIIQDDRFNLNRLMEQLYEEYSPRAREQNSIFKLKNGLGDKKSKIITDKSKLTRILSNLLINAIKFTGQGKVRFGYGIKHKELLFFVKDTGIGIPVELQKVIFKRFENPEPVDNHYYCESSLGLSICSAYVEMLGGRIWVESTPGLGSSFYFTIPHRRP